MKKKLYTLLAAAFTMGTAHGQIISTYAGTGAMFGYTGDGGAATAAKLRSPGASVMDASGNLYIADKGNNVIRKVTSSGIISTIAGTGTAGLSGDDGAATAAALSAPLSVAVDGGGNVYVADYGNSRIRKINTSGIITTIVGSTAGWTGDGGAATAAYINSPTDVSVDGSGNLYICDYGNNRVRKVNTAGIISTVAGTGFNGYNGDGIAATTAQLSYPNGIYADQSGNIFIADKGNQRVRKVNSSGVITTIAGNGTTGYAGDHAPATAAWLSGPVFVVADVAGNVFFSDMGNAVVRRVGLNDTITTVAGSNVNGFSGDGGLANAAQLSYPTGVTFDAANNLYITEQGNCVVRRVGAVPITITGTTTVCAGATTTLSQNVTDDGVWLSSNTAVATVNRLTGVVTGVSLGTATVSFSLGGGLGTTLVTVNPAPNPGVVTGATSVCMGSTVALSTSGDAGGTWSTGSAAIATVSASGVVTGVSAGNTPIMYTVTNSCGTAGYSLPFLINNCTTNVAETANANIISVFPNPSSGSFNISLPASATMPARIKLVNSVGQIVKEQTVNYNNKVMMDLHVRPGIYLLSVTTPNGHYTTSVMIAN